MIEKQQKALIFQNNKEQSVLTSPLSLTTRRRWPFLSDGIIPSFTKQGTISSPNFLQNISWGKNGFNSWFSCYQQKIHGAVM